MSFAIEYAEGVMDHIEALPAHIRSEVLDKIVEQLTHQPTYETRNKKFLPGINPPWESTKPVWELRIGEYRVFYEVDDDALQVLVRLIRRKPPHKTTEEIL